MIKQALLYVFDHKEPHEHIFDRDNFDQFREIIIIHENFRVVEGKRLFNLGKFNDSQFNYRTELAKNKIFYRLKFQQTPSSEKIKLRVLNEINI